MKRIKKKIIFLLTFVLFLSSIGTTGLYSVKASQLESEETNVDPANSSLAVLDNGILIDGEFYTPKQFEKYLKSVEIVLVSDNVTTEESSIQFYFALAPTIYFVPGVGQVALLATGAIVVSGVTIATGTWLYKTISNYFNDPVRVISSNYGIPKSLLDSSGRVRLGSFKDKHGNTPLKKSAGSFKNGKWSVEKDTAGHGGRAWKLIKII